MIAVVPQDGLQMTILPGFSLDREQGVFKRQVAYGDEVLTLCVTKEWMRRSLEAAFETDAEIEQLFNPATWVTQGCCIVGNMVRLGTWRPQGIATTILRWCPSCSSYSSSDPLRSPCRGSRPCNSPDHEVDSYAASLLV